MKRYTPCILSIMLLFCLLFAVSVQAQNATIQVVAPTAGERWDVGRTYSIQWKTNGAVDKVQILLIKSEKTIVVIKKDLPNKAKGDHLWTVPDNLPLDTLERQDVRIRVMSMDGKTVGTSAGFVIGGNQ